MAPQHVPENYRGRIFIGIQDTVVPLTTIFVLLRLYARCVREKAGGWDDLLMFFSGALSLFGLACGTTSVSWGLGQHLYNLKRKQFSMAMKWLTIGEMGNYAGLCLVRLSVGFFLLRLIPTVGGRHIRYRKLIIAAMVINVVASIAVVGVFATQCVPLDGVWDADMHVKCFAPEIAIAMFRLFSCISAVIDFTFALLPLLVIKDLQMNRQTKISLAACLSLGCLTGFIAISKAVTMNTDAGDVTYDLWATTICALLEVNVGMIAACRPGIRQFVHITSDDFKKYKSRVQSNSEQGRDLEIVTSDGDNTALDTGNDKGDGIMRSATVEVSSAHLVHTSEDGYEVSEY